MNLTIMNTLSNKKQPNEEQHPVCLEYQKKGIAFCHLKSTSQLRNFSVDVSFDEFHISR